MKSANRYLKTVYVYISKRVVRFILILALVGECFQCSRSEDGDSNVKSSKMMILPRTNQSEGKLLAQALQETSFRINKLRINPSDTEKVQDIAYQVTKSISLKNGYKTPSFSTLKATPTKTLNSLLLDDGVISDSQKEYLLRIKSASMTCNTYAEFTHKLADINNEIVSKANTDDKALLLHVTTTLHYGLDAINIMANKGIFSGNSEKLTIEKIQVLEPIQAGLFPLSMLFQKRSGNSWWDCAGAIAVNVLSGAAIVGATIVNPGIWVSPSTWWMASSLVAGNMSLTASNCGSSGIALPL